MKYCKKCVQPDTRPGIYFSEQGICGACLWKDELENIINWDARQEELKVIMGRKRKKARQNKAPMNVLSG